MCMHTAQHAQAAPRARTANARRHTTCSPAWGAREVHAHVRACRHGMLAGIVSGGSGVVRVYAVSDCPAPQGKTLFSAPVPHEPHEPVVLLVLACWRTCAIPSPVTLRCRRRLAYGVEWEPSKRMRLEQAAGAQRSTLQPICRAGARDLAHGDLTPRCISEERQRRAGPSCPNLSHFRLHIVGLVQNTLAQLCCCAIICKYLDVESCLSQFIAFRAAASSPAI